MADKEKLFLSWTCCCEVVSLNLLGRHAEGSKAERWRISGFFSLWNQIQTRGRCALAFHLRQSTNFLFVCLFKEVGIAVSIIYSRKCSNACKLEAGSTRQGLWSWESVGGQSEGGVLGGMGRLRTR